VQVTGSYAPGIITAALPKRIAILGSTGSIGCNALDVIEHLGADFRAVALSARTQTKTMDPACRSDSG